MVFHEDQCDGSITQAQYSTFMGPRDWNYPIPYYQLFNEGYNSMLLHQGVTNENMKSGQTSVSGTKDKKSEAFPR